MTAEAQNLSDPHVQFHVTLDRNALLKVLSHAQSVVEKRNTVPILANILLETQADRMKMTATDTEMAFESSVEAKVHQAGRITVSAHMLYDVVRKLKDGAEIDFKLNPANDTLELKSNRSDFKLAALPADEFPVFEAGDRPHKFAISSEDLRLLLDRTSFSMAMEETRYYLNGVYMHVTEDRKIRAVATDGHRLAQVELESPTGAERMPGVIVSRKTVNEIRKLAEETTDPIEISLSDSQIAFQFATCHLISRLIDAKYPDYQRVIPEGNDKILEVDAGLLNEAVDRAAIFATDKEQVIKLSLDKNLLKVKAFTSGTGSADEEIEVAYEGGVVEFGFTARYILDITQISSGQTLQLHIADQSKAVIVKVLGDESSTFVLMPLRV